MSEFSVATEPRARRSARARAARDAAIPPPMPSPLSASSPTSASQSAASDSHAPPLLPHRGVSVVHEVTDRELFAAAVAVVPNLQTLLTRRAAASRRRDSSSGSSSSHRRAASTSSSAPSAGAKNLHWVVKKKRHGLEIKEFDRGALAAALPGAAAATRSSITSADARTPRPAAARPLRTPRWYPFNRGATAEHQPSPAAPPSFSSSRGSVTARERPSAHRYASQQPQSWPHCDERVAFAAAAHVELGCRLSEALELLFSTDALQFDATMSSVFGHSNYKRGDLLLAHALPHGLSVTPGDLDALAGLPPASSADRHSLGQSLGQSQSQSGEHAAKSAFAWLERDDSLVEPTQPGWVSLQSVTLRPRLNVSLPTAALRRHKLSLAAYAQCRPARDEAVYVLRTLPRELQARVNATAEGADGGEGDGGEPGELADEISVGYHLAGSFSDMSGHQTRITMCAYVRTPELDAAAAAAATAATASHDAGLEQGADGNAETETPRMASHQSFLARHQQQRQLRRRAECSASARYVVSLLAAATSDLDKLLRRRRLGGQAFILTPLDKSVFQQHDCRVCARRFGLLRAELFCQLCGHLVCRDCSRKFEVEPVARRVRRNRVCFACVAHVDASGGVRSGRRERRRSARRGDARGEDEERAPAFLSARGARSAASMWSVLASHDKDAGDPRDARRVRRAFSMDYVDASSDVNDVDDIVDAADGRRVEPSAVAAASGGGEPSSAATPPLTPGRQLADALFSGNPLSRARALEVVRRVVQQVTQQSDEAAVDGQRGDAESEQSQQQQQPAGASCTPAADSAMLRKYLEARRRLSSISSWKAGVDGATPAPLLSESKPSKDAMGADDVCKAPPATATTAAAALTPGDSKRKAKGGKKLELRGRPWEFRLSAGRAPTRSQTHISSATETEDDDEELDDAAAFSPPAAAAILTAASASLGGVCEVAAARLRCPMTYVVSVERQAPAKASVVGAFEAASARHALPDRTAALCAVAASALAARSEPVVVPSALLDPAFRPLADVGGVRFLAAFPIRVGEGEGGGGGCEPLAWLCAADSAPRDCVTLDDYAAMQALAKFVADLVEQPPRAARA